MARLRVGDRAFYEGLVYKIVGATADKWMLFNEVDPWKAIPVPKFKVERVIDDVYTIGDKVISSYTFQGIVTGFEYETNRVLCKSTRESGRSRCRYAYKEKELTIVESAICFEPGKVYVIQTEDRRAVRVKAVQHSSWDNYVLLCEEQSEVPTHIVFKGIPANQVQGLKLLKVL